MKLVNGAQFLKISSLLVLFTAAPWAAVFVTDILCLTSICALL